MTLDSALGTVCITAFVLSNCKKILSLASAHEWLDGILKLIPREDTFNKCIYPLMVL